MPAGQSLEEQPVERNVRQAGRGEPRDRAFLHTLPTAQRLFLAGQYVELRDYVEGKIARGAADVDPAERSYLCGAYWKLQQYDKLLACSEQMEQAVAQNRIKPRGMFEWDSVYSYMWSAALGYLELGEYDRAVEQARYSYEFGREHKLDPFHQVYSLGALALAYALRGERANALRSAELLDQVDTSDYKFQSLVYEKWTNLAKVYLALGEYDQALAVMQRPDPVGATYKLVQSMLMGKGALTYQKLPGEFMLAKCLFETGHRQEAKPRYDAILKQPAASANRDVYWIVLFDRGRIAEQEGQLDEAIRFYEQAVQVIEETRATFKTESTKIGYAGDKQAVYQRLVAALVAGVRYDTALEYVERSKSRALVDLLASKQGFALPPAQDAKLGELLRQMGAAEQDGNAQGKGNTQGARRSFGAMLGELSSASPQLASLVSVTRVSVPTLQRLLPNDETLVEYYATGERLYAFVLTPSSLQAVELGFDGLPHRIQEFRAAIADPGSQLAQGLAEQLYAQLVQPLAPLINTQKLTIVPHGMLHYLPFAALHDGSQYLIDRYSLRYLPSASVIEYLQSATPARPAQGAFVIGNPDLPGQQPLAYAEQEAAAVAGAIADSTVLLGKQATETAFKQRGGQFAYLHLATHGHFASESPLRSGLWLAKDADNDGLLSVEELYSLHLNADLVTLSACETGLSKVSNGDDLVGLARGFLYAGSRAIVASLWSVDDAATSSLMSVFYANLAKTGAREALRQAQRQTRARYPHPFYWAAFELTGQG